MIRSAADVKNIINDPSLGQSLLVLRGYRDTMIKQFSSDYDDDPQFEAAAIDPAAASAKLHSIADNWRRGGNSHTAELVEVFDQICRRIARLEREACHAYVEPILATA